jgi:nitroimidazol reductase NimA-like FMN-containing flavoprotein (pyridoxamine 5'-phosphate oxidase superfamily)
MSASILDQLHELFTAQSLAVLSTDHDGHPYASLVAFASSDDLGRLFFATDRDTRKFSNLRSNSNAALLIDNRANSADDFTRAIAVTALGNCRELAGPERAAASHSYLEKHPHLEAFVSAPSCALMQVRVRSYYLVSHFRNVIEYHIAP